MIFSRWTESKIKCLSDLKFYKNNKSRDREDKGKEEEREGMNTRICCASYKTVILLLAVYLSVYVCILKCSVVRMSCCV